VDVRNGLPCDAVEWSVEDHTGALWLQTDCALVRVERDELDDWISDPASSVDFIAYDTSDGAVGYANLGSYGPKVSRAADGRLWFATYDGVGVIDPKALPSNPIPPPVHIEQVVGDGATYAPSSVARLPARVRDVRIEYTALSLGVPDKVAFRYRLEGRDGDWVEAGNRRQAFYTDLPPGSYRFQVIAANDRGVWNEDGATWEFSIASAYYQTSVFRLAVVASVLLSLTLLYRLRLRHVSAQLDARFQERLDERARVAQTLHDTLFQGFVSSHMLLHAVADEIADQSARSKLTRVLQRMHLVIEEGRETVSGLRVPVDDDLESALVRDAEYFKGERQIDVRLAIKGNARPPHPLVRDALYQISREALANTFRHARPTHVEIEIEYSRYELIVRVRDDGCGIAPQVVDEGRSGHFGLSGMRERAERIGAVLRLWSGLGTGTEVEIHVPAKTAFPNASPDDGFRWWRRTREPRNS
jgi:signal transduction histidine kinase